MFADSLSPRFVRLSEFYADGRISKSTTLKWLREGKLRVARATYVEPLDSFLARQVAERPADAGEAA